MQSFTGRYFKPQNHYGNNRNIDLCKEKTKSFEHEFQFFSCWICKYCQFQKIAPDIPLLDYGHQTGNHPTRKSVEKHASRYEEFLSDWSDSMQRVIIIDLLECLAPARHSGRSIGWVVWYDMGYRTGRWRKGKLGRLCQVDKNFDISGGRWWRHSLVNSWQVWCFKSTSFARFDIHQQYLGYYWSSYGCPFQSDVVYRNLEVRTWFRSPDIAEWLQECYLWNSTVQSVWDCENLIHVDMVCRRKSILCQSMSMSAFMFGNLMNDWLVASPLDPIGSTSTIPWWDFFLGGSTDSKTLKDGWRAYEKQTSHYLVHFHGKCRRYNMV